MYACAATIDETLVSKCEDTEEFCRSVTVLFSYNVIAMCISNIQHMCVCVRACVYKKIICIYRDMPYIVTKISITHYHTFKFVM